jgi:protein-S-isoprenylcysteine O-methyltransferase Ste14
MPSGPVMSSGPLIMVAYFIFFAAVHSLLADSAAKQMARSTINSADRWYRLAFVLLAAVMVLPFFYILLFFPDRILYVVPPPWRWLMMFGQALAALALLGALRQTGISYFFGLAQISGKLEEEGGLVTDGFYCHLRNPLFFFGALFLWLFPIMTANLLTFNLLATLYFYIGALHEEKSLRKEFGEEYEVYRRKVPMFIPRLRCKQPLHLRKVEVK